MSFRFKSVYEMMNLKWLGSNGADSFDYPLLCSFCDKETDTVCPNCWCGDYTTEWAEVNPFYFRDRNDLLLAGEEQRKQEADVKKRETDQELLKRRKVIK